MVLIVMYEKHSVRTICSDGPPQKEGRDSRGGPFGASTVSPAGTGKAFSERAPRLIDLK